MKANAPEKIYLQENTTTDCYGEFWPEWFESRAKDTDVEYIRADAFVKRTCEWIKSMWSETDDRFKEDYTGMLIDNFKNYIKVK